MACGTTATSSLPPDVPTLAKRSPRRGYDTAAFVSSFVLDRQFGLARGFAHYDDALDRAAGGAAASLELGAARRSHGRGGRGAGCARHARRVASRSSSGSTSTTRTSPIRRRRRSASSSPAAPTTARSPSPTRWSARCSTRSAMGRRRAAGGRGRRPRREPRRARREHPRPVRLRQRAARAAHHRLAGHAGARRSCRAGAADRRRADDGRSRGRRSSRRRGREPAAADRRRGGDEADRRCMPETYFPQFFMGWAPLRVDRAGRWKYIDAPEPELYDLSADPGEQHQRLASAGARTRRQPASARSRRMTRRGTGRDGADAAERRGATSGWPRSAM